MCGMGVLERRAPGWRTSSLHMDVRFLAFPETLYPPLNANYEVLKNQRTKEQKKSGPKPAFSTPLN